MSRKRPLQLMINEVGNMAAVFDHAWSLVIKGIQSGPVTLTIGRPSKNRIQEAKYHAMIGDIADTVEIEGRSYDLDTWKALLVDSYEQELFSSGDGLRHPSKTVVTLDGKRAVTIRPSTTDFLKAEASGFIEYLYSYGSEVGAVWSEKSLSIYGQYKEAQ